MDPDLEKSLEEAWARIGPMLKRNPDELAARKARRRMSFMQRPHRAWCLAVRANDTRLTPYRIPMVPDRPVCWDQEHHLIRRVEHQVYLEKRNLAWLCRPVSIPFPGETVREVARLLGAPLPMVRRAMRRGQFSVRYVKGLGGAHGNVAILYTKRLLDPAGITMDRIDDAGWATMWRYVSEHIPQGLSQPVLRRPVYRPLKCSMQFVGWRWICPSCGQQCHRVYCPIPGFLASFVPKEHRDSPDTLEPMPPSFACGRCHGVHDHGRLNKEGWNELVTYLSGGLLYGREVKRPRWYTPVRKRAWAPRRITSRRRAEITRFLLDTDLTCPRIARRIGIATGTVYGLISRIYRRAGVHSRQELRRLLGALPQLQQARTAG